MSHRKLQQEIDRVFKKINEGLEIFDGLYERHSNSLNSSQKDKLEADLKKEIKKLQRFREQIKNWQSTNDVKDKEKLLEYRRLVEVAMEQYKTVEKNSKQKAYSDQSLMNTKPKEMDPEEKERYDTIQFLNTCLSELERQIEALEAELDNFKVSKKGKKGNSYADNERKSQITEFLRIDRFHQEKWEQMLRLLENDVLSPQQVNDIKDGIEYFLETNQDPEFYEDDAIYDELNMDENDLINEVNVQLKEQKEEEERVLLANILEEKKTSVSTTPIKQRSASNLIGNTEPAPVISSLKTENETPMLQIPLAQPPSTLLNKVTPLTTSFAAAASATHTPVATSLKPAPFPSKVKPDMTWSAAVGANATDHDSNHNGSSPLTVTSSPLNKNRSTSPPSTINNGTYSRTSMTATPSAGSSQALNPSQPTLSESLALKQSLSSTIKSLSLVISDSSYSASDSDLATDADLLLLPPGLQDIISSFVTVRKGPEVKVAKPIDSCATLLRGYRDFSPLPEKIVPNPEEAQKAYNTWMFVKCNGKIADLIGKVDDATLFFIYYYSILYQEKKLAEQALFAKGWKLHKSKIFWLQRLGEPLIFPSYEQGHYRVFDASKWSVQEHPGFQLVYADFSPEETPFKIVPVN